MQRWRTRWIGDSIRRDQRGPQDGPNLPKRCGALRANGGTRTLGRPRSWKDPPFLSICGSEN